MSLEPLAFRGVECTVCNQTFDDMDGYRGHEEPDGKPCPGGTPT